MLIDYKVSFFAIFTLKVPIFAKFWISRFSQIVFWINIFFQFEHIERCWMFNLWNLCSQLFKRCWNSHNPLELANIWRHVQTSKRVVFVPVKKKICFTQWPKTFIAKRFVWALNVILKYGKIGRCIVFWYERIGVLFVYILPWRHTIVNSTDFLFYEMELVLFAETQILTCHIWVKSCFFLS